MEYSYSLYSAFIPEYTYLGIQTVKLKQLNGRFISLRLRISENYQPRDSILPIMYADR